MASAEVLPNAASSSSRKQEHLEAGKRRLEEFRKKKAAEKAKKAAATSQSQLPDNHINDNQHIETEVRLTDSVGAGTSDGGGASVVELSGLHNYELEDKVDESFQHREQSLSNGNHMGLLPTAIKFSNSYTDTASRLGNDQESTNKDASFITASTHLSYNEEESLKNGTQGEPKSDGITMDQSNDIPSSQFGYPTPEESQPVHISYSSDNIRKSDSGGIFQNASASSQWDQSGYAGALSSGYHMPSSYSESRYGAGNITAPRPISESVSSSFTFDSGNFLNHERIDSGKTGSSIRSRPSFLDSINISRDSSSARFPLSESQKTESTVTSSSDIRAGDIRGSSAYWKPETKTLEAVKSLGASDTNGPYGYSFNSPHPFSNVSDPFRESLNEEHTHREDKYHPPKQDENFAALEQHIEDLTQEKFSLQRALEASRALAESLAAENSSLTDSYNQQGSVVNQLKFEMENLQEEIKAQLVELEAVKIEYVNVQLECSAADERAKLLASEVIGLEDKALKLRSSELKLERQLENAVAEISSCKKRMSSLEKECQDLQSTIHALQEEKKLLQSKVRKASSSGRSNNVPSHIIKKEASTSTEDLVGDNDHDLVEDSTNVDMEAAASLPGSDTSNFSSRPGSMNLEASSVNIPAEQMRMIQNINELISELALEKEQLAQALESESVQNLKLKDLNKELSRKLEGQTQRLELLTAQSMANENVLARPTIQSMQENTLYADEGDEVVDRVLGWIMKLFPGGPSKRRTSKLL